MSKTFFDFESGDLSLDFANTKSWHASQKSVEHLSSYADIVTWGQEADLITAALAHQILNQAAEQPEKASNAYDHAILFREALYNIYSSLYAREPVPPDDLALVNSIARKAMAGLELVSERTKFRWEWTPGISGIDTILWPVARAAAELLTSDKLLRVRECEDDRGCGTLFIDQSKNHSRRWCSMDSCGNRAKARRHQAKIQST